MAIDLESLTAAISEEAPAGPDLSYDALRSEIEGAFERSISADDDAEVEVDWRKTIAQIEDQASQTRDIWLAVYLMRAGAKAGRLDTVEEGASLLAGLLENLWDSVHPQLDDYGFQGRKGPCESLTKLSDFLNPLKRLPLLTHQRLGVYSGADFDRFRKNGDSENGYGMFRALLQETSDEDLQAVIDRIANLTDAIKRADAVLTANADGDTATNFQPTYDVLGEIRAGIAVCLKTPPAIEEASGEDSGGDWGGSTESGSVSSGPAFSGGINSREDVIRALDAISDYYARREPSSAVPFALRRARDWVTLDFMSILEDIAPNSLDEAKRVLMTNRASGYSDYDSSSSSDSSSGDSSW